MTFRTIVILRRPGPVSAKIQHADAHVLHSARAPPGEGQTYNLRQIEGVIADGVEDEILEAVDDIEQLLTQRRHGAERRVGYWSLSRACLNR